MNTEPLTPLQQSAASTGRRYFATPPAVYASLTSQIDANRAYPHGAGTAAITERGLSLPANQPKDASGRVLVSVETWRITADDDAMLAPAIAAGHVVELTSAEYAAALPAPAPLE